MRRGKLGYRAFQLWDSWLVKFLIPNHVLWRGEDNRTEDANNIEKGQQGTAECFNFGILAEFSSYL
jgi:hypothetical protein